MNITIGGEKSSPGSIYRPMKTHELASTISSSAATPYESEEDDVILIERNIETIDLCTPKIGAASPEQSASSNSSLPEKTSNVSVRPPLLCAICLRSSIGREPHSTRCGHVFCGNCIKRSMISKKFCPTCKKFICSAFVRPLFV